MVWATREIWLWKEKVGQQSRPEVQGFRTPHGPLRSWVIFNKALSRAEEIRLSVLRGNLGRVAGLETAEQGSRNQEVMREARLLIGHKWIWYCLAFWGCPPWPRPPYCTVPGSSILLGCKRRFIPLGQAWTQTYSVFTSTGLSYASHRLLHGSQLSSAIPLSPHVLPTPKKAFLPLDFSTIWKTKFYYREIWAQGLGQARKDTK